MDTKTNLPPTPGAPLDSSPMKTPGVPKPKQTNLIFIIVAVVVTAAVIGGVIYWWQNSIVKSVTVSNAQQMTSLQTLVTDLQAQLVDAQNDLTEQEDEKNQEIENLKDDLLETEMKLAIMGLWGVDNVVRDDTSGNLFYYTNNFSGSSNIGSYNLSADLSYSTNEVFDIPSSNAILYSEEIGEDMEFNVLGTDGSNLVFWEREIGAVAEECTSAWLTAELSSIDITSLSPSKTSYTVSDVKKTEEQPQI